MYVPTLEADIIDGSEMLFFAFAMGMTVDWISPSPSPHLLPGCMIRSLLLNNNNNKKIKKTITIILGTIIRIITKSCL